LLISSVGIVRAFQGCRGSFAPICRDNGMAVSLRRIAQCCDCEIKE
jgi:hypothetical protein